MFSTALLCLRADGSRFVVDLFKQNSPGDPRQFIGDGDDDFIACGALFELMYPVPEAAGIVLHSQEHGPRSVNEHPSQIAVAPLTDAVQLGLTPG